VGASAAGGAVQELHHQSQAPSVLRPPDVACPGLPAFLRHLLCMPDERACEQVEEAAAAVAAVAAVAAAAAAAAAAAGEEGAVCVPGFHGEA